MPFNSIVISKILVIIRVARKKLDTFSTSRHRLYITNNKKIYYIRCSFVSDEIIISETLSCWRWKLFVIRSRIYSSMYSSRSATSCGLLQFFLKGFQRTIQDTVRYVERAFFMLWKSQVKIINTILIELGV